MCQRKLSMCIGGRRDDERRMPTSGELEKQAVYVGNQAVPWPLHPSSYSQCDTRVMDSFVAG